MRQGRRTPEPRGYINLADYVNMIPGRRAGREEGRAAMMRWMGTESANMVNISLVSYRKRTGGGAALLVYRGSRKDAGHGAL